jgi:hypothetical protein
MVTISRMRGAVAGLLWAAALVVIPAFSVSAADHGGGGGAAPPPVNTNLNPDAVSLNLKNHPRWPGKAECRQRLPAAEPFR